MRVENEIAKGRRCRKIKTTDGRKKQKNGRQRVGGDREKNRDCAGQITSKEQQLMTWTRG